jgi:hypothetical protein
MPSDRTFVTEVATGLGMVGGEDPGQAIAARPAELATLVEADWSRLERLWEQRRHRVEFAAGFANGRAFWAAPDGLNRRRPRLVEWTGGRRAAGDEVVPADLRVDHVYLVSCKYLSRILHNPSPARLIDALLAQSAAADPVDWYRRTAPDEHQALYRDSVAALGLTGLPAAVTGLGREERRKLAQALRGAWPSEVIGTYARLCARVSQVTADRWRSRIATEGPQRLVWRLLRIGSAPYFILGADGTGSMRLRIATPWDWQQDFVLRRLEVEAQDGGQPRVGWRVVYLDRRRDEVAEVAGHVELRWSHGRFAAPPEAKVYLDTPHHLVPGYHPI